MKQMGAPAQRRQTSLRVHLSRARGVVVSHPLSMREALGSIPSVSILVHHADAGRKGKTNGAQAARPAIMAPRQLSPQSGQREYSGLGKLADRCAPWGVAVQRNRRAHQTPALSEIGGWPVVLPRGMVLICAVGSSIQAEWANWTGKLSGQTGRANRSANKAGKPSGQTGRANRANKTSGTLCGELLTIAARKHACDRWDTWLAQLLRNVRDSHASFGRRRDQQLS